jgi:hypothetical protein
MTVIDDDKCDRREGHSQKVEEQRGRVVERVFNDGEGHAP